jgi:hypothetical protein
MNIRRPVSKLDRGFYLSLTAAFWFFIAASAPHRVHHFFEQLPASTKHHVARLQANGHSGSEHDHDRRQDKRPSQQNDCLILSVAQNAYASVVQSFSFADLECAVARRNERPVVTASSFNPAPFSQRAPPPPLA